MKHSERVPAGDAGEDMAAKLLMDAGIKVERPSRRDGPWDLMANGHAVDVKAATYTAIKGSDGNPIRGFVFSNMHKDPTCDFYLLLCLSKDRSTILGYYLIPTGEFRQRTLTLTETMLPKLEPYKSNLNPLKDQAAKTAARAPMYTEGTDRALRRVTFEMLPKRPLYSHAENAVIGGMGAMGGMMVMGGGGRLQAFSQGSYSPSPLRAALAATAVGLGLGLGKMVVDQSKSEHDGQEFNDGPKKHWR